MAYYNPVKQMVEVQITQLNKWWKWSTPVTQVVNWQGKDSAGQNIRDPRRVKATGGGALTE